MPDFLTLVTTAGKVLAFAANLAQRYDEVTLWQAMYQPIIDNTPEGSTQRRLCEAYRDAVSLRIYFDREAFEKLKNNSSEGEAFSNITSALTMLNIMNLSAALHATGIDPSKNSDSFNRDADLLYQNFCSEKQKIGRKGLNIDEIKGATIKLDEIRKDNYDEQIITFKAPSSPQNSPKSQSRTSSFGSYDLNQSRRSDFRKTLASYISNGAGSSRSADKNDIHPIQIRLGNNVVGFSPKIISDRKKDYQTIIDNLVSATTNSSNAIKSFQDNFMNVRTRKVMKDEINYISDMNKKLMDMNVKKQMIDRRDAPDEQVKHSANLLSGNIKDLPFRIAKFPDTNSSLGLTQYDAIVYMAAMAIKQSRMNNGVPVIAKGMSIYRIASLVNLTDIDNKKITENNLSDVSGSTSSIGEDMALNLSEFFSDEEMAIIKQKRKDFKSYKQSDYEKTLERAEQHATQAERNHQMYQLFNSKEMGAYLDQEELYLLNLIVTASMQIVDKFTGRRFLDDKGKEIVFKDDERADEIKIMKARLAELSVELTTLRANRGLPDKSIQDLLLEQKGKGIIQDAPIEQTLEQVFKTLPMPEPKSVHAFRRMQRSNTNDLMESMTTKTIAKQEQEDPKLYVTRMHAEVATIKANIAGYTHNPASLKFMGDLIVRLEKKINEYDHQFGAAQSSLSLGSSMRRSFVKGARSAMGTWTDQADRKQIIQSMLEATQSLEVLIEGKDVESSGTAYALDAVNLELDGVNALLQNFEEKAENIESNISPVIQSFKSDSEALEKLKATADLIAESEKKIQILKQTIDSLENTLSILINTRGSQPSGDKSPKKNSPISDRAAADLSGTFSEQLADALKNLKTEQDNLEKLSPIKTKQEIEALKQKIVKSESKIKELRAEKADYLAEHGNLTQAAYDLSVRKAELEAVPTRDEIIQKTALLLSQHDQMSNSTKLLPEFSTALGKDGLGQGHKPESTKQRNSRQRI